MKQAKKSAKFWLCIALVLCLVSALGASLVQNDFGKVTVKDLRFETSSGLQMSALLFVPENATAQNPAPAIVCSHGWYNNREMQDLNYVEYARRGFVVLSIDMYGHGNSDDVANGDWWLPENNANGMYDAVKMVAGLPYVDTGRIGVTGHSNGALASRTAVMLDNEVENPLISAVLLVSNDAVYKNDADEYFNMFGNRDAGIVACQYDEFFHRVPQADGGYSAPRDYIDQATAQSFLYFGTDPASQPARSSYTLYTEAVDGQDAIRVVYNPNIIHPWAHFSGGVVKSSLEFFDNALGAPKAIGYGSQVWQIKAAFNALGLVGVMMLVVSLAKVLLGTKVFASLKASATVAPAPALQGKAKGWFWISSILASVFSFVFYMTSLKFALTIKPGFMLQGPPWYIGLWAAACGVFGLLLVFVGSKVTGNKADTTQNGVKIGLKKLGLTIALALVVVSAAYGLVFAADYLFKTDFRLWVLTLKAFDVGKLPIILSFLPLFLIYYVANSVIVNSYNYFEMGKKPWINTAVNAMFNALPSAVAIAIMYICFAITGLLPHEHIPGFGGSIIGIWLFPVVIILPLAAVVSRKLYKETRNPYLAGIIMALLVTIMSCTNTLTQL